MIRIRDWFLFRALLTKIAFDFRRLPSSNKCNAYFYPDKSELPLYDVKHILEEIENNFFAVDTAAFPRLLQQHMDAKHLKASDVYIPAVIEKSHLYRFLKGTHLPSRDIIIKICLALKLNRVESNDLMMSAGYSFFNRNRRDVIILNCIKYKSGLYTAEMILEYYGEKGLIKK